MLTFSAFAPGVIEMTSAAAPDPVPVSGDSSLFDLDHALRRAEEESIAAVRAIDPRVEDSHAGLAALYTERSLRLIDAENPDFSEPVSS